VIRVGSMRPPADPETINGILLRRQKAISSTLTRNGSRRHEHSFGVHAQLGRDQFQPFGQGFDLEAAELAIQRLQLPIGVGYTDLIRVEDGQLANAAARERFCNPGPNATHADHRNVRRGEARSGTTPVKSVDSGKSRHCVHGLGFFGRGRQA
jgi:hypothetical protein